MPRRFLLFCSALLLPTLALAQNERPMKLPLGDGFVSFKPQKGYIYSCHSQFAGGGAFRDGAWIQGKYWYPDGKIQVSGNVAWPSARIHIQQDERTRIITGNGLPLNQTTGIYPVRQDDEAYQYDRNPNAIEEQYIKLMLPVAPKVARSPNCLPMGVIGVTLTGVGIYNGLDAMGRDAAAHEIQDHCNGHPEHHGQYHYHNWSNCIPDKRETGSHSKLVGYMLDGFGIFGPYGEQGQLMHSDDLDVCHGHRHEVEWDGKKQDIYHYHFTMEYPYTASCFKGEPVEQHAQGGPSHMMRGKLKHHPHSRHHPPHPHHPVPAFRN